MILDVVVVIGGQEHDHDQQRRRRRANSSSAPFQPTTKPSHVVPCTGWDEWTKSRDLKLLTLLLAQIKTLGMLRFG